MDSNNKEENVRDNNSHFEWVRLDHYGHDNLEEVTGTDVIFMLFGGLLPKIEKEVQHNVHIGNLKNLRNIAHFDLNTYINYYTFCRKHNLCTLCAYCTSPN